MQQCHYMACHCIKTEGIKFFMTFSLITSPRACLLFIALIAFGHSGTLAQPSNGMDSSREMIQQINALLRDGDLREALPLIRQYNDQFPGSPSMLYNQACAENSTGNTSGAVAALDRAAQAGFDDFHRAQNDPDLQSLAGEPGFQALVLEHDLAMSSVSQNQGISISLDTWSQAHVLLGPSARPGETLPRIQLKVLWQSVGLAFEISGEIPTSPDPLQANNSPWAGGDAINVTIALPTPDSAWESENAFHFLFGRDNGMPTGALYLPNQKQWQQIEELAPKIGKAGSDEEFQFSFTIPWELLEPVHPLVDRTLGLNVSVRQASTSGPLVHTLMKDPSIFRPNRQWHRYAPLTSDLSNLEGAHLFGRLSHSISVAKPIGLELEVVSPTAGPASLRIDFMDSQGLSVLDESRADMTMELQTGSNSFAWPVDFTALRTGPYAVRATVDYPGGESLTWETPTLHLQPGWIGAVSEYLDHIPAGEKATVALVKETLIKAIPELKNRRNPLAIGKTLRDLLGMADRAERFGSILPEEGPFVMASPGAQGDEQLYSLYFPPGYREAKELLPVLVLNNYRGFEMRMAERMDRFYEYWANAPDPTKRAADTVPVYIFPHLPGEITSVGQDGTEEAARTAQWASDFFAAPEIAVVGIDACLGDALGLANAGPSPLAGMLLVAGRGVRIWPNASQEFLAGKLPAPKGNLPVKWLDFPYETGSNGQAPDILSALKKNKWNVIEPKGVKGALGITQVTDRIILWAENLR